MKLTKCAALFLSPAIPSLVLAISVTFFPASIHADAASTGTAIGTGIKNAITAAFPAISTIINAIWPKQNDPTKQTKATATQATKELQQQSVQGLSQMTQITSELDTITLFLANCIVADDQVIAMRTYLDAKTTITPADVLQLNDYWNTAKGRLGNLKSAGSAVAIMNDASVQVVLQAVVNATAGPTDSISQELSAGTPGLKLLNSNLQQLDGQLSAANALSGQVIQNISLALKTLKNNAGGAQGQVTQSKELQQAQTDFATIETRRLNLQ